MQALSSGKPPKVVDKMVQGRLRKYYEETVLLDQKFVINDSLNVQVSSDAIVSSFPFGFLMISSTLITSDNVEEQCREHPRLHVHGNTIHQ